MNKEERSALCKRCKDKLNKFASLYQRQYRIRKRVENKMLKEKSRVEADSIRKFGLDE